MRGTLTYTHTKYWQEECNVRIFIVGMGTIGEPLANLFLEFHKCLGITEIIIHKNTPDPQCRGMLKRSCEKGARLAVYREHRGAFEAMLAPVGVAPTYNFEEALDAADVVIDCTAEKIGRKLKETWYGQHAGTAKRFIAQGSEKGFGMPYAFNINDEALTPDVQFIQAVSCNTHQILCVLKTFAQLGFLPQYGSIAQARFVIFRRASDISQTNSIVGVEGSEPVCDIYGSHQGEDAMRVLKTMGITHLDLHTRALKANNSFMHVVEFYITLTQRVSRDEIIGLFRKNPLTPVTYRKTSNEVFAQGRDWGHFGRILNQTVVSLPLLEVKGQEIYGTCFTPQDGNALLSSVAATLFFRNPETYRKEVMQHFGQMLNMFAEV